MANNVKVSVFSSRPPASDGRDYRGCMELMLDHWRNELPKALVDSPDLIVLPEACDRPATLNWNQQIEYYDFRKEAFFDFFAEKAKRHSCYIAFCAVRQSAGKYFNSTQMIDRNGEICGIYDKNYPIIQEIEEENIVPGTKAHLIECDFGSVACSICFDLNFDELWRQYAEKQPDIVIFSSMYHGGIMQQYRAYQCRSFFAASVCDRASSIITPCSEILASTTEYTSCVTGTVNLDNVLIHLDGHFEKITAIKEKYGEKIKIHDPGNLASVLISCESDELNISDVIEEFSLETLDDYFLRSIRKCKL